MADRLLVTGFHRSGTSAAAGLLHRAGLQLGERLIGARTSNPYGHFEDADAVAIDDELLAAAGTDWQADHAVEVAPSAQLRRFVADRDRRYAQWAVKDPRISLLLGAWREALGGLPLLAMVRRPGPCVRSLIRREARLERLGHSGAAAGRRVLTEAGWGLRMWTATNQALLDAVERAPDASLVVTEASLRTGFPLVSAVVSRFGLRLGSIRTFDVVDPRWADDDDDFVPGSAGSAVDQAIALYGKLRELEPAGVAA